MKPIIPSTLLAALLAVGAANAAATDPVGYVSLGNTAVGVNNVPVNTDISISIPLMRPTEFAGTVASVAGNVITLSGTPGFTAGQWAGATPYYLVIEGGTKSGLIGLITANGTGDVTVTLPAGENLTGVVATDAVSISKAWTVSSLFAGNTLPDGVELFAYSGTVTGINLANDLGYVIFGGAWFDSGTFAAADNVVLYPGESFVVRNSSVTPIADLVVSGQVPTQKHRTLISKLGASVGQDNRVGYVGPVSEVIGQAGFLASDGDEVLFPDNAALGINKAPSSVVFFGGAWFDGGTFADVTNTFNIQGGVGYVYRRIDTAPVGDTVWTDVQTYISTL